MKRIRQRIDGAVVGIAVAFVVLIGANLAAAAIGPSIVYVPLLHGQAVRLTGSIPPPAGTSCLLQTGASMVVDPRTDAQVFSCESKNGHGAIVFTAHKLLLDHAAVGSGSLSVVDGAVYLTAVNENGSLEVKVVPTP